MSYGYLRENTASYWIAYPGGVSTAQYPLDGQGGATTTSTSSQVASCGPSNPVIIEAIEVQSCSTAVTSVRIKDHGNNAALFIGNVPVSTSTQWFPLGGAYGVQVNQGFCVTVDNGTNLSGVKVYYRFAGQ